MTSRQLEKVRPRPKPQNSRCDPIEPASKETLARRVVHPHTFGGGQHSYKPVNIKANSKLDPHLTHGNPTAPPEREYIISSRELENEEMELLDELHDLQAEVRVRTCACVGKGQHTFSPPMNHLDYGSVDLSFGRVS